jgi:hypothetical protein
VVFSLERTYIFDCKPIKCKTSTNLTFFLRELQFCSLKGGGLI